MQSITYPIFRYACTQLTIKTAAITIETNVCLVSQGY